jgi:hypothetical protein
MCAESAERPSLETKQCCAESLVLPSRELRFRVLSDRDNLFPLAEEFEVRTAGQLMREVVPRPRRDAMRPQELRTPFHATVTAGVVSVVEIDLQQRIDCAELDE